MAIVHQHAFDFAADKACTRCGKPQPLSAYHKQASKPDGHKSYCKACCSEINAARYADMPVEQRRAYRRAYYQENKDAFKRRAMASYRADPTRAKARISRWNQSHREERRLYNQRTRHKNPAPYRETVRRRYARRKGASVVRFTVAELRAKCAYWGNRCWLCGGPQQAIDHVKPLNKGGLHVLANQRPICRLCNSSKGDTWPFPTHRRW